MKLSELEKLKSTLPYLRFGFIAYFVGFPLFLFSAAINSDYLYWLSVALFYGFLVMNFVEISRVSEEKFPTFSLFRCFLGAVEQLIILAVTAVALYKTQEESNPIFIVVLIIFLIIYRFIPNTPSREILAIRWGKRPWGKIPDSYVLFMFLAMFLMTLLFGARFYFIYL